MSYAAAKIAEAEECGDMAALLYWKKVKLIIDGCPRLTESQRVILRLIFAPDVERKIDVLPEDGPLPTRLVRRAR